MPAIPISPASIAKAVPYSVPQLATPMNTCKPPQEGLKCVPMQFKFASTPVYSVNMATGNVASGLSQVASLFVDATNSTHDVNILFPDTGYQVRINFGDTRIIPALTGTALPFFYVILDSGGATNATDTINILAINQFIPPAVTEEFKRTVAYGYGQYFSLNPILTQSSVFNFANNLSTTPQAIIPNTQWYITGITLDVTGTVTAGTSFYSVLLLDAGVQICQFLVGFTTSQSFTNLCRLTGMNYVSSGSGNLQISINGSYDGVSATAYCSIFGGVLVT